MCTHMKRDCLGDDERKCKAKKIELVCQFKRDAHKVWEKMFDCYVKFEKVVPRNVRLPERDDIH